MAIKIIRATLSGFQELIILAGEAGAQKRPASPAHIQKVSALDNGE
jgi:hypothetical protein